MARSDLVVKLAQAGIGGDRELVRRTVEAIIAEESARQHHIYAQKLVDVLRSERWLGKKDSGAGSGKFFAPQTKDLTAEQLYIEIKPTKGLDTISMSAQLQELFGELVEEHQNADFLRSHAIDPRNRIMLTGAPGNGKTSLAAAIAYELGLPFYVIRYEAVIGSYLGETASRLKAAFDFFSARPCVIFFDEFDAIGKERGDVHDTGEIKRVVSSLLLQIDGVPSYNVFIAATNHPELIDRAAWRRFQIHAELPLPNVSQIEEWLSKFEILIGFELGADKLDYSKRLLGSSFSVLEQVLLDVRRKFLLSGGVLDVKTIMNNRVDLLNAGLVGKDNSGNHGKASANRTKSSSSRRSPERQSEIF